VSRDANGAVTYLKPGCNPRGQARRGRAIPTDASVAVLVAAGGARPILVLNPVADTEFRDLAQRSLDGVTTPRALQEVLRERYPAAVVRPRELAHERDPVWYIYRDGRWVGA
jgi:hypothetical protein